MICKFFKNILYKRELKSIEKSEPKSREVSQLKSEKINKPYTIALTQEGIKEISGERHSHKILDYHTTVNGHHQTDEISWCSSFMNWCFMKSDMPRTGSAAAISWAKYGKETKEPKKGDIVVFRRRNSTWQGHVGFYVEETEDKILVFGGNQGNKVCFQWYPKNGSYIYLYQYRVAA